METVQTELDCTDEPAMDDQIRVAADRRREVRVAAQIQSEMPVVFSGVFSLGLRAQDYFIDELFRVATFHASKNPIECFRFEHTTFGERYVQRGKELTQGLYLLDRGFVVHAINKRHASALESLSRRHVGQDHEFFDQPMRFQTLGRNDAVDGAIAFKQNLALW